MWWRTRDEPLLSDAEFNEELEHAVEATRNLLEKEPTPEYFHMLMIVRAKSVQFITLTSEDEDQVIDDFDEFSRSVGLKLRRTQKRAPQAIFLFFPSERDNVIIHGATPDGRLNAAIIYLERDEEGHLRVTDSAIDPYPTDPFETHYARSVMSAYAEPSGT